MKEYSSLQTDVYPQLHMFNKVRHEFYRSMSPSRLNNQINMFYNHYYKNRVCKTVTHSSSQEVKIPTQFSCRQIRLTTVVLPHSCGFSGQYSCQPSQPDKPTSDPDNMSYRVFQTANGNRDNSLAKSRTQQISFRSSCCQCKQEPLGGTGICFYQAASTIKITRQLTSPVSPELIGTVGQVWASLPKV